ncbi:hypothetical protein GGR57DRAFT_493082 [Xylariaceae sp. FL1272]|nr:hypothetical protein GGR57DRAFT_493082 [Xylariaceae sp. FL1272]
MSSHSPALHCPFEGLNNLAFVTGGVSGIGKACCLAFAKLGARGLLIADLDVDGASHTASEYEAVASSAAFKVVVAQVDVTIKESVGKAAAQMVDTFGRMDYCVHSAGGFHEISSIDYDELRRINDIHTNGTFLVTSTAHGTSRGFIVLLGSVSSVTATAGTTSYTTSKHAIVGHTKSAAVRYGIRVNCVCPSWADTPMVRRVTGDFPGAEQQIIAQLPMGRLALPGR